MKKINETSLIKDINEDTNQMKKFVIILAGVALVAGLLYLVSSRVLIKDGIKDETIAEETITYTNIDAGSVFNRPYEEYYVFAYDSDSLEASIYSALINSADSEKGKIYTLDLSSEINKKYVKDSTNKNASKPSELALKEPTLIKIEDGKISKYLETLEEIEKELK